MKRYSVKLNKITFVMIAITTVLVLTMVFTGCTSPQIQVNKILPLDASLGETAFEYMQTLASEEYADRTMGTEGELNAAKYLASKMSDWGYTSEFSHGDVQGLQYFETTFKRYTGAEVKDVGAYNVIFTKKSNAESIKGEIVLSCQYDNLYGEQIDLSGKPWGADGSYESGSGVAILLTLAQQLKEVELDYDLTFIFFTGGSYCWKGAMQYASQLDRAHLNNIALVLNYAMLGGGEKLYVYNGESSNSYGSYLNACSDGATAVVPKDRNIAQFILSDDAIYNYVNVGMLSNQYFFMNKGVATANFLSLNWDTNANPLFTEYSGKSNVYHTPDDTLANMIDRKGESEIKSQLSQVITTTLTALDKSNASLLQDYLDVAEKQRPNAAAQDYQGASLTNVIFKAVLIGLLIAMSYMVKNYVYKNRKKLMPVEEKPEQPEEPFENNLPKTEDFDEKLSENQEKKQETSDFEDPFA